MKSKSRCEPRCGSQKRAETWVQAEVKQALVGVDFVGDERSGDLLKEFKKTKHQDRGKKRRKKYRRLKKEREAEKLRERSGEEEEK